MIIPMRNKINWGGAFIIGILLCTGCTDKDGDFKAERIFSEAQQSIVRLHSMDKAGNNARSGTGFALKLKDKTKLVTNKHVTEGQDIIIVEGLDSSWLASRWKEHKTKDLAIIELPAKIKIAPLKSGDSTHLKEGINIYTIGHPLGLSVAIYEGIINSLNEGKIIFSAPLSEGASGSPLLNSKAEVIGVCDSYIAKAQNYNMGTPLLYLHYENVWKERVVKNDRELEEYLTKLCSIKGSLRKNKVEWGKIAEANPNLKEYVIQTSWTRDVLRGAVEDACISFAAIDWGELAGKNNPTNSRATQEVELLIRASKKLREVWEEHKEILLRNKGLNKDDYFWGIEETENFISKNERLGLELSKFLKTNSEDEQKGQLKSLIMSLGEYTAAQNKFFGIGIP
jgi:hypothetical protein